MFAAAPCIQLENAQPCHLGDVPLRRVETLAPQCNVSVGEIRLLFDCSVNHAHGPRLNLAAFLLPPEVFIFVIIVEVCVVAQVYDASALTRGAPLALGINVRAALIGSDPAQPRV